MLLENYERPPTVALSCMYGCHLPETAFLKKILVKTLSIDLKNTSPGMCINWANIEFISMTKFCPCKHSLPCRSHQAITINKYELMSQKKLLNSDLSSTNSVPTMSQTTPTTAAPLTIQTRSRVGGDQGATRRILADPSLLQARAAPYYQQIWSIIKC